MLGQPHAPDKHRFPVMNQLGHLFQFLALHAGTGAGSINPMVRFSQNS
jgi:hypothetical protein